MLLNLKAVHSSDLLLNLSLGFIAYWFFGVFRVVDHTSSVCNNIFPYQYLYLYFLCVTIMWKYLLLCVTVQMWVNSFSYFGLPDIVWNFCALMWCLFLDLVWCFYQVKGILFYTDYLRIHIRHRVKFIK